MEQEHDTREPRQVTLTTALLMTGGGLLAGMLICLCASTIALLLTGPTRGAAQLLPVIPTTLPTTNGGGTIAIGDSVTGAIWNTSNSDEWTFEGVENQIVTIEVRGDATADPWVWLIGPDGQVLGDNDDSFGGLDSYLNIELPADGTYTIRVEMLSGGGYTLRLD